MVTTDKFYGVSITARVLGLPKDYLRQLADAGQIPAVRVKDKYRFKIDDVRAALDSLSAQPAETPQGKSGKPVLGAKR